MTRQEAVILCRTVAALCPQQRFDTYTPDTWFDVLGLFDLEVCRQAAMKLGRKEAFVAPSEIVALVEAEREPRLNSFQYEPVEGDDDPEVYIRELREQRRACAEGRRPPVVQPPEVSAFQLLDLDDADGHGLGSLLRGGE